MIAEVVPLIRFPRSQGIFDFTIPPQLDLRPGQIVRIPFGRRQLFGLVWKIKQRTSSTYQLKEVDSIHASYPALPLPYLKIIERLATEYFVSPALFAQLFIPDQLARKKITGETLQPVTVKQPLDQNIKKFLAKRADQLIITDRSDYISVIAKLIATATRGGQQMVIVPDFNRLNSLIKALPPVLKKNLVVIHSKLSAGSLVEAYHTAIQSKAGIIIGTRRALFVPAPSLKTIWLIDEDDPSHKQYDLSPRFDTNTVADHFAKILKVKIIRTALTPRLTTWKRFAQQRTATVRLGHFSPVEYIQHTGFSMSLPPVVEEQIAGHIKNKRKVLVIAQQRDEATAIHCQQCGHVLTCPACRAVISRDSVKTLKCKRCAEVVPEPKQCPRCHSTELRDTGLTPTRLAKHFSSLFPNAQIKTVAAGLTAQLNGDIIIATEHILSYQLVFGQAIIMSLEQLLSRPSFDAEFRAWQVLNRLRTIATTVTILGNQEHPPLVTTLNNASWNNWYESIWQLREQWHYPPAWHVRKLMYRHKDQPTALREATTMADTIRKKCGTAVEVVGPFSRYPFRSAGAYRYALLVRWHYDNQTPDLSFLSERQYDEWHVDSEPLDAH